MKAIFSVSQKWKTWEMARNVSCWLAPVAAGWRARRAAGRKSENIAEMSIHIAKKKKSLSSIWKLPCETQTRNWRWRRWRKRCIAAAAYTKRRLCLQKLAQKAALSAKAAKMWKMKTIVASIRGENMKMPLTAWQPGESAENISASATAAKRTIAEKRRKLKRQNRNTGASEKRRKYLASAAAAWWERSIGVSNGGNLNIEAAKTAETTERKLEITAKEGIESHRKRNSGWSIRLKKRRLNSAGYTLIR